MEETNKRKGGRIPKVNLKSHCVMVRFDDAEWVKFLTMFERSGMYAKAVFIKNQFFNQPFRVLNVDKTFVDYYTKLSDFHAQFRAIGTNYNQVIKILRSHFSEKKTMALLYRQEQHIIELVKVGHQIEELSRELKEQGEQRQTYLDSAGPHLKGSETQTEEKWSQKSV